MIKLFFLEQVSPLQQVASSKSHTGTMGMRTIVMREIGGKWANSYAVKVFSPQAEGQFRTGGLVAATLRFRATTNQVTGTTYQDVVAEEIVAINTPTNTPTTVNNNENYNIPF